MDEKRKKLLLDFILEKSDVDSVNEIPLNESLLNAGILDSFGIIELVEYIEEKFLFKIEDEEFNIENFGSVMKILNFLDQKID